MFDVELSKLNEEIGNAESRGDKVWLSRVLAPGFVFRRASGRLMNAENYLKAVEVSSDRTTTVDKMDVFETTAIAHCTVATNGKKYRNIRLFVRLNGEWRLLAWANEEKEEKEEKEETCNMTSEGTERGILEIDLVERISVFDLSGLLACVNSVYISALWLKHAERAPTGQVFPDKWDPPPEENLWIEVLAIGTPNQLKISGKTEQLTLVATFLTLILSVPGSINDAKEAFAQSPIFKNEIESKCTILYNQGKVSDGSFWYKTHLPELMAENMVSARKIMEKQMVLVKAGAVAHFGR